MSFLEGLPKPFFILAPMDDVTDTVFRQIIASLAPPDLYFTEFVNVDGLQSPGRARLLHKLRFSIGERPLVVQLWGLKPENYYKTIRELRDGTLAAEANFIKGKAKTSETLRAQGGDAAQGSSEAHSETYNEVRRVSTGATDKAMRPKHGGMPSLAGQQANAALSYAGVDLNMGCPVKTVIKNGACAALMNNRELASEIIDASREAADKDFPVSIKTRVGFTTVDMSWIEFLLSKKLDLLSIHARTAKQKSAVSADWEMVGKVREMRDVLCPASSKASAGRPVTKIVGNGDVMSRQQGLELAKRYKLDGIMIGRGAFGDPFIFSDNSPWGSYTRQQKIELYRKHVELFMKTYHPEESRPQRRIIRVGGSANKQADAPVMSGRRIETLNKFCKIYVNGFDGAKELREHLMQAKSADELLALLAN